MENQGSYFRNLYCSNRQLGISSRPMRSAK
jgi:hypothetical protein